MRALVRCSVAAMKSMVEMQHIHCGSAVACSTDLLRYLQCV